MAELPAAVLAPEALETGIRRALARTLEHHADERRRGQSTYLTVPVAHLPILAELQEADVTIDWCVALDGNVFVRHDRATICTMPRGSAHVCRAMTLRRQVRPRDTGMAVAREPLVAAHLDTLSPLAQDSYVIDVLLGKSR